MMRTLSSSVALLVLAAAWPAHAALSIGAGSVVNFADGSMDLGCGPLTVVGQLSATSAAVTNLSDLFITTGGILSTGSSQIALSGDFSDAGNFVAGAGRVSVVDACSSGPSQFSGASNFYDLSINSAGGKQIVLPASVAQSVTHGLILQGASGALLQVTSNAAGQRAELAVSLAATQTIAYVDVRDNVATAATIAPGAAALYNSVDAGNLVNWFASAVTGTVGPAVPAPTLGIEGRLALLIALLAIAIVSLFRRGSTRNG